MTACKWPQVRNHATGRCKKPCGKHQGVSPNTGKCVTKTYLEAKRIKGDFTKKEYLRAIRDDGITRRDGRSRRSGARATSSLNDYGDFNFTEYDYKEKPRNRYSYSSKYRDNIRDGLVRDKSCPQGWRNRLTWRCKTPCEPGKVINPLTMGCVTKAYAELISPKDFDDYDTDEDDADAANLKWTPTTHQTSSVPHTDDDMKKFINDSQLGVADLRVLRGLALGATKGNDIYGIYSPSKRQQCDKNTLISLFSSEEAKCGFRNLTKKPTEVSDLLKFAGEDYVVSASADKCSDYLGATEINDAFQVMQKFSKGNYRTATVCKEGVLRTLYRVDGKGFAGVTQEQFDSFKDDEGNVDYEATANFLNHVNVNRVSFAYHKFDKQTSV